MRKYLIDTNIFLEILLLQEKQKDCKGFIENNFDAIALTQFTLNSIGVCCYRNNCLDIFTSFLQDIVLLTPVLTLNFSQLILLEQTIKNSNLDYDDSYQFIAAQANDLEIVTLDKDFKKIKDSIKIHFL